MAPAAPLTPPVPSRGASWRQPAAAAAILGLLAVIGVAQFGHDLARAAAPAGDHLGLICLIAAREILVPVHWLFHLLLTSGLLYAGYDRVRAVRALRSNLGVLEAAPPRPGDPFWTAAGAAGLPPDRLRIIEGLPTPAFTAGWWTPRVFVARALAAALSPEELTAVLVHEAAHVRRRDPLRFAVLRFLAHALWWLPTVRHLSADAVDQAELAADDAAAAQRPVALASALLALARWPRATLAPALRALPGLLHVPLLDRRVRRLVGEVAPLGTHVTGRSVIGAVALLIPLCLSGLAMTYRPSPVAAASAAPVHCTRHHSLAIYHLFCLGFATPSAGAADCPHAMPGMSTTHS
jgi:Zn-dependent protease with chaperone function